MAHSLFIEACIKALGLFCICSNGRESKIAKTCVHQLYLYILYAESRQNGVARCAQLTSLSLLCTGFTSFACWYFITYLRQSLNSVCPVLLLLVTPLPSVYSFTSSSSSSLLLFVFLCQKSKGSPSWSFSCTFGRSCLFVDLALCHITSYYNPSTEMTC